MDGPKQTGCFEVSGFNSCQGFAVGGNLVGFGLRSRLCKRDGHFWLPEVGLPFLWWPTSFFLRLLSAQNLYYQFLRERSPGRHREKVYRPKSYSLFALDGSTGCQLVSGSRWSYAVELSLSHGRPGGETCLSFRMSCCPRMVRPCQRLWLATLKTCGSHRNSVYCWQDHLFYFTSHPQYSSIATDVIVGLAGSYSQTAATSPSCISKIVAVEAVSYTLVC